ncbi:MAG: KaiC 1, partial [Proteobacteria bacterium]|nr:KaiC 1 [Pseudomonadota bacterium]
MHLRQRLSEGVSQRTVRVHKYRGSGFAENEFPMVIGRDGISIAGPEAGKLAYPVSRERISTGLMRL